MLDILALFAVVISALYIGRRTAPKPTPVPQDVTGVGSVITMGAQRFVLTSMHAGPSWPGNEHRVDLTFIDEATYARENRIPEEYR